MYLSLFSLILSSEGPVFFNLMFVVPNPYFHVFCSSFLCMLLLYTHSSVFTCLWLCKWHYTLCILCFQILHKQYRIVYPYAICLSILYSWAVSMSLNVNFLLFNCGIAFPGRKMQGLMFTFFWRWMFGLFPVSCRHEHCNEEHSYTGSLCKAGR